MKFYLAPLEGITGYVYRNAYHSFFKAADKYFTPFIAPNQTRKFSTREHNDVLPRHNQGLLVVPQILTNKAEDFIWAAEQLKAYGYQEVNLNLGCPSKTVVSKYRGAGFLARPEELDRFLEQVFDRLDMRISIKTRIGKSDSEEFAVLLEIYNRYPMEELIIHPRLQQDYYRNTPNWEIFAEAAAKSRNKLCYNGDIFTEEDFQRWRETFPEVERVMLGRGVLVNPGLPDILFSGQMPEKQVLRQFHDKLFHDYDEVMSGEKNVLFKMKELWLYMGHLFTDSGPYTKKIKKAQNFTTYLEAVEALFHEQDIVGA